MNMKYLNKIIFINSANISYAEISVDGSVHFTGTQGVGKSTVLRVPVFFYNADKQHLGIQQGQKSFDEFYFPHINSYILYEVLRENGAYTILVGRHQGRVSWRFIDAPYQKKWLVDDNNQVLSDWGRISERIDKDVAVSARIDNNALYRDIIFGNSHDHRYARYALVKSSHYQNIPRSIQNVFLNTKLDADFVKKTIIQSMPDADLILDLQPFRSHISRFREEYKDIACWFPKTPDSSCSVPRQASEIAEQGRRIAAYAQEMLDVWHMLNYAVAYSENHIPFLERKVAEVQAEIEKENNSEKELTEKYDKERDNLNQKLGAKKVKLEEIEQARKYFEDMKIDDKLKLAARESVLKQERCEKETLLDGLLKDHRTVEEKYDNLRGKIENARQLFKNTQLKEYYLKQDKIQRERRALEDELTRNRTQLLEKFNSWRHSSDDRMEMLLEERNQAKSALKELQYWHPKANEIKKADEKLQQLDSAMKENGIQQRAVKSQLKQIETEYKMAQEKINQDTEHERERLEADRTKIREQIVKINDLLARLDGSFYTWLCENAEGWENTIGKVVDEERILYAQGLAPRLGPVANGMFGVTLNLDNIASVHRTPDEYRSEKNNLEEQEREINRNLIQLSKTRQEKIDKQYKVFSEPLEELRNKLTSLTLEAENLPLQRQELQNLKYNLGKEEQEQIAQEQKVREQSFKEALRKVNLEKEERNKYELENKTKLEEFNSSFNKAVQALDEELRLFKADQDTTASQSNKDFEVQMQQLNEQQKAELAGMGVDMELCEQYKRKLNDLNELLAKIDEERSIVLEYEQAKKNLFAQEPDIKKGITTIKQEIDTRLQYYKEEQGDIILKRKELQDTHKKLCEELIHRKDGLEGYRQMVEHEHLVPPIFSSDDKKTETNESCQALIAELRKKYADSRKAIELLQSKVCDFNRNFTSENIFDFNTTPETEEDYLKIASGLQEFIDNNKIDEFRRRTSRKYRDILLRISSEINSLMKGRSDVDRVIQEINRDFKENNFVGAIKSIELKTSDSDDKLMRLLIDIHSFVAENDYSLGELNLFSNNNKDEVNRKVVDHLAGLSDLLLDASDRSTVSLADAFRLQFRVKENDNDTGWVERINNVGSDGTDILVKAMVNIMLINVFKKRVAKKSGDFIVHCMMDEIGRLHLENIKGLLQFAQSRNIYLINGSPMPYNPHDYRYTYRLTKDGVTTRVARLLKRIDLIG